MFYVKTQTGQIITFLDVQEMFPRTSLSATGLNDDFLEENNLANLDGDDIPEVGNGQYVVPTQMAHEVNGEWLRVYDVEDVEVPENPPPAPSHAVISSPNGTPFAVTVTDAGKIEVQPLSEVQT